MKLFIATITPGHMTDQFVVSLLRAVSARPVDMVFRPVFGGAMVPLARNEAVSQFLQTDCTDILFIDSDIEFLPNDIARICSHDMEVVGGCYPLKQPGQPTLVLCPVEGARPDSSGLMEATGIGTGFLRIRRGVFERMAMHSPESLFFKDGRQLADWFPVGPQDGQYWGEDIGFCRRWRAMGGRIFADLGVRLNHIGQFTFRCEPDAHNNQT
jgi:hypothetical protein